MRKWLKLQHWLYWVWCHWTQHRPWPVRWHTVTKGHQEISYRECRGCGLVYREDAKAVLDRVERDLEESNDPD